MKKTNCFVIGFVLLSFLVGKLHSNPSFLGGFNRTESGLYYKIHSQGNKEQINLGDLLFSIVNLYWCDEPLERGFLMSDSVILGPLGPPMFPGDFAEGLLMMNVGGHATFVLPADSAVKYWELYKGPEFNNCDWFKVDVYVEMTEPFDSVAYLQQREADSIFFHQSILNEIQVLQNYVQHHHPSLEPNNDGVYVVVLEKGSGKPVLEGKTVVFDFTARLLDGSVWDSSDEDISYDAGIAFSQRIYKPQELVMGQNQWMISLDNVLVGQTVGSKLRLFMPSGAVFGPYETVFFGEFQSVILDIDLLDVK
jgi:FKBP-type peptidyl-prolyl cis-trans isomerase